MNGFTHDPVEAMSRAYRALADDDLDGFARPLAPGIVPGVIAQIQRGIDGDVGDLRTTAIAFEPSRDHMLVRGRFEATDRRTGTRVCADFRHEWELMYGLAWRFEQHVDAPRLDCA